MMTTISKVHTQSDGEPNNQPSPIDPAKFVHHVAIEQNPQNWHQRHPRSAKWPWLTWIRAPQHKHCNAHDDEGKQCANIHHLSDIINGSQASHNCCQQAHKDGVFPRCTPLGMYSSKEFLGQQTVISHGVKHAGLTEQHDQHHAG